MSQIEAFDKEAEELVNELRLCIERKPQPKIIYHYTNDVGLRGILETKKLWLSDRASLNDPSEWRHGVTLAHQVLEEKGKAGKLPEKFSTSFRKGIDAVLEELDSFVCSFNDSSKDGDDLEQWRAYADDGRGYAIGFDREILEKCFIQEDRRWKGSAFHVLYGDQDMKKLLQELINAMPDSSSWSNPELEQEFAKALAHRVLFIALHYKHEGYENENEFRLVRLLTQQQKDEQSKGVSDLIKVRARQNELVRYTEFSLPLNVLKEIVVGPTDLDKGQRFARACVKQFAPNILSDNMDDKIRRSKIPYCPH